MTIYYSTNREVPDVTLDTALLKGQAGDRGLFLPRPIPKWDADFFVRAAELSYPELAAAVLAPYAEGVFSNEVLKEICAERNIHVLQ